MRRQLVDAMASVQAGRSARGPGQVVLREVREAYAALPPEKGVHAPPDATLAERIRAMDQDTTRWRLTAETLRSQMRGERQAIDDHDWAAIAAGYPPHPAGTRRAGCPGCAAMPPREALSVPAGSMPAAADVPQAMVDALLDGLATAGSGGCTHDIPDDAARAGVLAVLGAYLSGGGGFDGR